MDIELRRLRAENAQLRQDLASCRQQLAALHAALKRQQPYAARATRGGGEAPRNSLDALWREAVEAGAPAELTFKKGDTLTLVEKKTESWWKCRDGTARVGMVPSPYLREAEPEVLEERPSLTRGSSRRSLSLQVSSLALGDARAWGATAAWLHPGLGGGGLADLLADVRPAAAAPAAERDVHFDHFNATLAVLDGHCGAPVPRLVKRAHSATTRFLFLAALDGSPVAGTFDETLEFDDAATALGDRTDADVARARARLVADLRARRSARGLVGLAAVRAEDEPPPQWMRLTGAAGRPAAPVSRIHCGGGSSSARTAAKPTKPRALRRARRSATRRARARATSASVRSPSAVAASSNSSVSSNVPATGDPSSAARKRKRVVAECARLTRRGTGAPQWPSRTASVALKWSKWTSRSAAGAAAAGRTSASKSARPPPPSPGWSQAAVAPQARASPRARDETWSDSDRRDEPRVSDGRSSRTSGSASRR